MKEFWTYTVLRLSILAAALGIVYLLGARGVLWLLLSFVLSAAISWVVLSRPRAAFADRIERRREAIRRRLEEMETAEDAADDAARERENGTGPA